MTPSASSKESMLIALQEVNWTLSQPSRLHFKATAITKEISMEVSKKICIYSHCHSSQPLKIKGQPPLTNGGGIYQKNAIFFSSLSTKLQPAHLEYRPWETMKVELYLMEAIFVVTTLIHQVFSQIKCNFKGITFRGSRIQWI